MSVLAELAPITCTSVGAAKFEEAGALEGFPVVLAVSVGEALVAVAEVGC